MKDEKIYINSFFREVFQTCLGTTMIKPEHWGDGSWLFDSGYINDRLKMDIPINKLSHERIIDVFSHLFAPDEKSIRYKENEAINASNALINILMTYFDTDFSMLKNYHNEDNKEKRTLLLNCIDIILSACSEQSILPVQEINKSLELYKNQISKVDETSDYPNILTALPNPQCPFFIGRQKIVDDTIKKLINNESCLLHGIGGIGKTEVAKSITKNIITTPSSETDITHIMWINYANSNFQESLISALNISNPDEDISKQFNKIVNTLNSYKNHLLLVIDNVESDHDKNLLSITSYLNCRILITSRIDSFKNLTKISVNELDEQDCKELFYSYYKIETDDTSLKEIFKLAEHHTVTLELLAKIANTEEIKLSELLYRLKELGFDLSNEEASSSHEKLDVEARIIDQISKLFYVHNLSDKEKAYLMRISCIPSLSFEYELAKGWFDIPNKTTLLNLSKLGWIKSYKNEDDDTLYVMHPVIAAAIQSQFRDLIYDNCQNLISTVGLCVRNSVEGCGMDKNFLFPYVQSIEKALHNHFCSFYDYGFLYFTGKLYKNLSLRNKAIDLFKRCEKMLFNIFDSSNENDIYIMLNQLLKVYDDLAMTYLETDQFDNSFACYEKNLEISKRLFGERSAYVARTNLYMAQLKIRMESVLEAIPYLDKANELALDLPDSYELLFGINTLYGQIKFELKEYDVAEIMYNSALTALKYIPEDTSLRYSDILVRIAEIYYNTGRIQEAYDKQIEAYDIALEETGKDSEFSLYVLNTVANSLNSLGNPSEALDKFTYIKEKYNIIFGKRHSKLPQIYNNIALSLFLLERYDESIENYKTAIDIYESIYGEYNYGGVYLYENICEPLFAKQLYEEAHFYAEKYLSILKIYNPEVYIEELNKHLVYSDLYPLQDKIDLGIEHLKIALMIIKDTEGENSDNYIKYSKKLEFLKLQLP